MKAIKILKMIPRLVCSMNMITNSAIFAIVYYVPPCNFPPLYNTVCAPVIPQQLDKRKMWLQWENMLPWKERNFPFLWSRWKGRSERTITAEYKIKIEGGVRRRHRTWFYNCNPFSSDEIIPFSQQSDREAWFFYRLKLLEVFDSAKDSFDLKENF